MICRRRSNLGLLAGVSVFVVSVWFSFLLGTIYASYFESSGHNGVTRTQREVSGPSGGSSTNSPGCNCPPSPPSGLQDGSVDDGAADAGASSNHLVSKERQVVSRDSPTTGNGDEDLITLPPPSSETAAAAADTNGSANTIKHDSYHLTWTGVEDTSTTVFSAYYDDRPAMLGPSIVIPGYQHKKYRNLTLYCVLRNKDGTTQCSAPEKSVLMEMDACNEQKEFDKKREREYLHVFHICRLDRREDNPLPPGRRHSSTQSIQVPSHVALSSNSDCTSMSTFIPVYNERPKQKIEFGVCIQTPAFGKSAQDFVSFIELYKMLGAQFFTLYELDIDHGTLSYLRSTYGGEDGILEIVQWTKQLNEKEPIHYYGEILAIHDCLYRNMHRVKYLAFVDLDEALIPRRYSNWRTMLHEIDQPYVDSFIFPNSIFMKTDPEKIDSKVTEHLQGKLCNGINLPVYFTNFNRVKCVFNYFSRSKLIVKPDLIMDTDIHGVCKRIGNTTHYLIPEDSAVSQHYRAIPTIECRKNRKTRKYPTRHDDWMIRYADPLLNTVSRKLCK